MADGGERTGARDGDEENRGDAVRALRDEWRRTDDARRRERHDSGSPADDAREQARERGRIDSLDSLDRIRADAPDADLETRRAADAAEREMERARRGRPRPPAH